MLVAGLPEEERGEDRREGERQQQRPGQGEDDRPGHRLEHLPLDAAEGEDREVDDDDDADPEGDGPDHLVGGLGGELPHRLVAALRLAEAADDVLHQDHRAVHDQAEVDRPQAHQVGRDAGLHHAGEGEQHRERDGRGHDQPRPDVAQEGEQDGHDEERPLEQVRLDRADDAADEDRAVVVRDDPDALGQGRLQLRNRLARAGRHLERVLAGQHLDEADHGLAPAVDGGDADAQHRPLADLGDAPDRHRRAVLPGLEDDLLDVGERPDEPLAAQDVLLPVVLDVAPAGVARPPLHGLEDVLEGDPVGQELGGVHHHLVLLGQPAPGVHLGDPGHRPQPWGDQPVEDGAALHRGDALALDRELEDVAEAGRHRPHLGVAEPGRDGLPRLRQPLVHELAGEVDVDAVLEDDGDRREAVARDRADLVRAAAARSSPPRSGR